MRGIGSDMPHIKEFFRMHVGCEGNDGEWISRVETRRQLAKIDELIHRGCNDIDVFIERANLLNLLDRRAEARDQFIELLTNEPTNSRALIEFGNLLSSMGYTAAACRVYKEAAERHPGNPAGHINLANLLLQGGRPEQVRRHY